jgi:Rrf2 family protein
MRSTRLVTAAYIITYVAANDPEKLTTDKIADVVQVHPSRARTLIADLVKAGLLSASRGPQGGVTLARQPASITLRDVLDAVGDERLLAPEIPDPFSRWAGHCLVHPTLSRLYAKFETQMQDELRGITIADLYETSKVKQKKEAGRRTNLV